MCIRKIFPTVLLLCVAAGLHAQPLSLQRAWELALENNKTLEVATLELEQALREQDANPFLPSVSLDAGISADASIASKSVGAAYTFGSVSFSLSTADKYTGQTEELERRSARNVYENSHNSVKSDVTTAYWNIAAAKLALEEQKAAVDTAQADHDTAVEKYEAGTASVLTVNQAKLALYDAQLELQLAEQAVRNQTDILDYLIGETGAWELEDLTVSAETISLEAMLDLVEETSAVRDLALAVEKAKLELAVEKNTALSPTFSLSSNIALSGDVYPTASFSDRTSVSFSVSVPLDAYLPDSAARVALDTAEMEIGIASLSYRNGVETLAASVESAYWTLQEARANLTKLEKHLELAETQLLLVRESYEAGYSAYGDLKDAEEDVRDLRLEIVQQQLNHTLALYDIQFLLETDLRTLIRNEGDSHA